jgi:hypothetical protein
MTIEMWDAACLQGPTVIHNQYYLLKNVRFIRGNDGYVEAKLVEAKIQKLEVDAVDDYPNFKALLELVVSRLFVCTVIYCFFLRRLQPHDEPALTAFR